MAMLLAMFAVAGVAQPQASADTSWKTFYQATHERINNLSHTKLDVRFDYAKSHLYGKAWLTLSPHFYPTDSLQLDAKGMDIKRVDIVKPTGVQSP